MSGFAGRGDGRGSGGGRSGGDGGRGRGGGRGREGGDGGRGRGGGGGDGGGGRGGGRGDGGRGGGRGDGGAGTGRNRHMGEVSAVLSTLRGRGMGDADILAVINPSAPNRDRSKLVEATRLPGHAPWRLTPSVGAVLDMGTHGVRSNHHRVDTSRMPGRIFQYHVHIYKRSRDGSISTEDCAPKEDSRNLITVLLLVRKAHPEWETIGGQKVGIAYDGKSALFTSKKLPFALVNASGESYHEEDVFLVGLDGLPSNKGYRVRVTCIAEVNMPAPGSDTWKDADATVLRPIDSALFSFARWNGAQDRPDWFVVGTKGFRSDSEKFELSPVYEALRGYYAGFKSCAAGLVYVSDMSVTCFLKSGELLGLMAAALRLRSVGDLVTVKFTKDVLATLNDFVKNAKCKLKHLGHTKKIVGFGPSATSPESVFDCDGEKITVAQYFERIARVKPAYKAAVDSSGKYLYPSLPLVNVGSNSRPVLIPPVLVTVASSQCRSQKMTPDMTAALIKHAAVRPQARFDFLAEGGLLGMQLTGDSKAFGLDLIEKTPMLVAAKLLPQAKLQYAGSVQDPGLSGAWNSGKFVRQPPAPTAKGYMYGVMVVCDPRRPPPNCDATVSEFAAQIEAEAASVGIKLNKGGPPMYCDDRFDSLTDSMSKMSGGGARIVLVMLVLQSYGEVKLVGDRMGLSTQCLRWRNVEDSVAGRKRGYHSNVMLKINTKLGGTCHTLISRMATAPPPGAPKFQDPPASLSWLFDKPTMLVGIDVSHAEPGSTLESMAAVVASMDGRASQYVAHLSAQSSRVEMVQSLENAMKSLLETFKTKNRTMPAHIIVYRDGVSDGQFEAVIQQELPSIQNALTSMGYTDDSVKVSIVICQKGHHTRFAYEENVNGVKSLVNACPGLLVDATGGVNSVASASINEFYLNSHVAIQGTAKPCKYALIYDEIGFKLSELELLTYWSCYLYCRCNRSVSYATPAYYAHWASKRGKTLFAAGGTAGDLQAISSKWAEPGRPSTMFFL